jgi:hypothetical protein
MTALQTHDATQADHRVAARAGRRPISSARHLVRHYFEMVVAMFAGMVVLGIPAGWALEAFGTSTSALTAEAPALMLFGMMATMTVPMVAWMRFRGHGRRANAEMAASMVLPTLAAVGLLATGVTTYSGSLMVFEHVAMLLGMLAAMLLRLEEYTRHHGHAHS